LQLIHTKQRDIKTTCIELKVYFLLEKNWLKPTDLLSIISESAVNVDYMRVESKLLD